ncbi:MAG: PhoH family protein [Desulforegulaceae bacterium]|nr:PhoH family protein [Desulforegulaceae bacterium]
MENKFVKKIKITEQSQANQVFGEHNKNLIKISDLIPVSIQSRGNEVMIKGEPENVEFTSRVIKELCSVIKHGYPVFPRDVEYAVQILSKDDNVRLKDIFLDTVFISSKKSHLSPKNKSQKDYIDAMREKDIVFGVGPAGTGKTYLAMAMAVSFLQKKLVSRIILARPAVEAGEALGFLPGDLAEKVNPYLRPLYDALHDMLSFEKAQKFMAQGVIEVAPLAFMRGRTLNEAFIILDEAQNTTSEQMKMFLTRIGFGCHTVVTGDITQVDLPNSKKSGLIDALEILQDVDEMGFIFFTQNDVVRHPLVKKIIDAYEKREKLIAENKNEK